MKYTARKNIFGEAVSRKWILFLLGGIVFLIPFIVVLAVAIDLYILALVFLGISLVFFGIFLWKALTFSFRMEFENDWVTLYTGFIARKEEQMPIPFESGAVIITIDYTYLGRIFKYGHVKCEYNTNQTPHRWDMEEYSPKQVCNNQVNLFNIQNPEGLRNYLEQVIEILQTQDESSDDAE